MQRGRPCRHTTETYTWADHIGCLGKAAVVSLSVDAVGHTDVILLLLLIKCCFILVSEMSFHTTVRKEHLGKLASQRGDSFLSLILLSPIEGVPPHPHFPL